MRLSTTILPSWLLLAATWADTAFDRFSPLLQYRHKLQSKTFSQQSVPTEKLTQSSPFLNSKTTKFLVNGTSIPEVNFDVGDSFAGSLPLGEINEGASMFFWFFPTTNPDAPKEIVIWLNGGPGCSSLSGLLQENGPFVWPVGVSRPYENPWSWHHLTNIVWVEQPVDTGFSTGNVTAKNEDDVAQQFMGFWKNFVDTFGMHGYSVYVNGESYAGAYCPYIASNMLDAEDTTYFDVKGMIIYDPVISQGSSTIASTNYFLQYWQNVFPFNDTTRAQIVNASAKCGYDAYVDQFLTFPPSGQQPGICEAPGMNTDCNSYKDGCDVFSFAVDAIWEINPGFNIYQVAQLSPVPSDPLGFASSMMYTSPGNQIYFNRTDVKRAIHAPLDVDWTVCTGTPVFADPGDDSDPSSYKAIPNVIEKTNNVQIGHGTMDMVLLANGTLIAIQNMTWNGAMGFRSAPKEPLFVPHHPNPNVTGSSGQGVLGTWHEERGLTWLLIELTGHMVPGWQPGVAFRQLQVLLGRIPSLNATEAFPQYSDTVQPDQSTLGFGTAPQLGAVLNGTQNPKSSAGSKARGHSNSKTMSSITTLLPIGLALSLYGA